MKGKIFLLIFCFFFSSCSSVKRIADNISSTRIVFIWLDVSGSYICKDKTERSFGSTGTIREKMLKDFKTGMKNLLLKRNPFEKYHIVICIIGEQERPKSLLATDLKQEAWQDILKILKFVQELELPVACSTDIYGTYEYVESYLSRYCKANEIQKEKMKCAIIYYSDMGHRAKRKQPEPEKFDYLRYGKLFAIFAPGEYQPDIQAREFQEQEEFLSKFDIHFSAVYPPSTQLSEEESLLEKCLKKL